MDEKLNKDNLLHEDMVEQVESVEKDRKIADSVEAVDGDNEALIDKKEEINKRLITLYKKGAMCIIALTIAILAAIAWFTQLRDTGAGGMVVTMAESPFELKSSGSDGLYDEFLSDTVDGYENKTTTAGAYGIMWNLTSTSQMNNLYNGSGTLTPAEFGEITRADSEDYGLKPGDSGQLDFSIIPNTSGVSVTMTLEVRGYKATFDATSHKTDDDMIEVTDSDVNNYKFSHILFFYKGTDNKKHLLTEDGFDADNITVETPKTIYWVWVPTLQQILDANIEALNDVDASKEVRRMFFENPGMFLKTTGNFSFAGITVAHNDDVATEEAAIAEKLDLVSGRNYSTYGSMYNDADQSIGDHINYILVELTAMAK